MYFAREKENQHAKKAALDGKRLLGFRLCEADFRDSRLSFARQKAIGFRGGGKCHQARSSSSFGTKIAAFLRGSDFFRAAGFRTSALSSIIQNSDFHSAVLRSAFFCVVGADRESLTHSLCEYVISVFRAQCGQELCD